ncbi:MAG: transcriptional repressor [Helicobacteraceae bacterium]|jgi:Fe2+ or Zn2+ uptake regulation protein|nr:transcriptional repressor [Helicobacteraceae bacterium]
MNYKARLNAIGLKATSQRLTLMRQLAMQGHLTIDAIYLALKNERPLLSLSTVYNNLSALVKRGIVKEVAIAGERQVFELTQQKHAHLICRKCGAITDVAADFAAIRRAAVVPNGAEIEEGDLIFNGFCARCAAAEHSDVA